MGPSMSVKRRTTDPVGRRATNGLPSEGQEWGRLLEGDVRRRAPWLLGADVLLMAGAEESARFVRSPAGGRGHGCTFSGNEGESTR